MPSRTLTRSWVPHFLGPIDCDGDPNRSLTAGDLPRLQLIQSQKHNFRASRSTFEARGERVLHDRSSPAPKFREESPDGHLVLNEKTR
jgi:hypothetical protein